MANKKYSLIITAAVFMVTAAVLNICLGASRITLPELWQALCSGPGTSAASRILWYVRLPGMYSAWVIAGASFLGAMVATFVVVIVARKSNASRTTVVLGGVAVTACLNAVTETIVVLIPDAALASVDFRVGGFSSVNHARLGPAAILIVGAVLLACTLTNELDVLSLGDDTAHSLGLRVSRMRNSFLTIAALLAGASVSFAGILGFVGLIVPHIARRFIGNESGRLVPFCALLGAGFVTICDLAARLVFAPYEVSTGILLNFLGGPFFVWLLLKRKDRHTT